MLETPIHHETGIYEGANIFNSFAKFNPMTGEEIAEDLGTTRQNVSRILKDAMERVYNKVKYQNKEMTPFEIATFMLEMFGVNQRPESETTKFFKLFPPKVRAKIEEDGEKILAKYYRKHKR